MKKSFDQFADYQPESFKFKSEKKVKEIVARYPEGKERSAVMPLLDLAQRQVAEEGANATPPYGGWISRAAMDEIARIIGQPPIKVYEVASFYSMYHLSPVGKYLLQLCTTTPCWLCGSADIVNAVQDHLGIHTGETTKDGLFTLLEVECLGACVNAPMMQVNDDYYEDLTAESVVQVLEDLRAGRKVSAGSQKGRRGSMALSGPTTLEDQAKKTGVV